MATGYSSSATFEKILTDGVRELVAHEADRIFDEVKQDLEKRLIKVHQDAVAKVTIELMAMSSFTRLGNDLVITIKNKFAKTDDR